MDNILFVLSFVMLFFGGELLVRSSVALALRMRISTLVIGMTVVSFATSSPELFVSVKSSLSGITDITFGNVIGSNIANITLVLGLTAIVFSLNITNKTKNINFPFMFFIFLFFGFVLYLFKEINQITGLVFIVLLVIFSWYLIKKSRQENIMLSEDQKVDYNQSIKISLYKSISYMIIGFFLLVYGSEFLVNGVQSIANLFKWDERIVSVSLVALGTSLPELATSLVAAFRKESNLAIGNLIGSNIFNVLAILGVTSIIAPIKLNNQSLLTDDYLWMMISVIILGLFIYLFSKKQISRIEGFLLFLFYIIYMFFLF